MTPNLRVSLRLPKMNSIPAEAVVKPRVGRKMTMKSRYQKVFFMIEWFSPDLWSVSKNFFYTLEEESSARARSSKVILLDLTSD